jgi:thiol peroxidase
MTIITLKGKVIKTSGKLPDIGSMAQEFSLIGSDLSAKTLGDFKGKNVVMNIFPSIDTGTCAASVRNFNKTASHLENTVVLCISRDLPFAQKRFCGAEGIENVVMLSDFNTGQFGKDYGLEILDGPLAGLNSRCILVLNTTGKVVYTEQVAETTLEPNYEMALEAVTNDLVG